MYIEAMAACFGARPQYPPQAAGHGPDRAAFLKYPKERKARDRRAKNETNKKRIRAEAAANAQLERCYLTEDPHAAMSLDGGNPDESDIKIKILDCRIANAKCMLEELNFRIESIDENPEHEFRKCVECAALNLKTSTRQTIPMYTMI